MRKWNWFYILAIIIGGLFLISVVYILLRASGVLYRLAPDNENKWLDYDS
jgi:hypothetical protein